MKFLFNNGRANSWLCYVTLFYILINFTGCATSDMNVVQNASTILARQLAANLSTNQRLRVGIIPLSAQNGGNTSLATPLQESLKNKLFLTKRFDVVEDDDMQKVIKELNIQEQGEGILREDTIHHMGELLGADAIIVGKITYTYYDNALMFGPKCDFLVDYHLVPVKSGVIGSVGEARMIVSLRPVEVPVH